MVFDAKMAGFFNCRAMITGCLISFSAFVVAAQETVARENNGHEVLEKQQFSDQKGKMVLEVNNIRESKGAIRVAVYFEQKGRDWLNTPMQQVEITQFEANLPAHLVLKDMPVGHYAIKLFHDINDNKQIDMDENGLPQEPFAFSSNGKTTEAPSLKNAIIDFTQSGQVVRFDLVQINADNLQAAGRKH